MYIQDERAFEDFVIDNGTDGAQFTSSSGEVVHSLESLRSYTRDFIAYANLLERYRERGIDYRVMDAIIRQGGLEADVFTSAERLGEYMSAIAWKLDQANVDSSFVAPHITAEDDGERFTATWSTRLLGSLRRTVISAHTIAVRDWRELGRIYARWTELVSGASCSFVSAAVSRSRSTRWKSLWRRSRPKASAVSRSSATKVWAR
jgi:hypothetical protein